MGGGGFRAAPPIMLHTALSVVSGPAAEPVSVVTARAHLRIDHTFDDALLAIYIATAREQAEKFLGRALITQTLRWTLAQADDRRPRGPFRLRGTIELPRAPVQSISSVIVTDADGVTTNLVSGDYMIDLTLEPARLDIDDAAVLTGGNVIRGTDLQHIAVTFVAGYGTAATSLPPSIINAVLLHIAFLYERRGDDGGELPPAVNSLLAPHRLWHFGGG